MPFFTHNCLDQLGSKDCLQDGHALASTAGARAAEGNHAWPGPQAPVGQAA